MLIDKKNTLNNWWKEKGHEPKEMYNGLMNFKAIFMFFFSIFPFFFEWCYFIHNKERESNEGKITIEEFFIFSFEILFSFTFILFFLQKCQIILNPPNFFFFFSNYFQSTSAFRFTRRFLPGIMNEENKKRSWKGQHKIKYKKHRYWKM